MTRGILRFPAVAHRTDEWREGEQVVGLTWLLGVLPFNRHHLTVARIDHERVTLTSAEHGGLIRSWVHDIAVVPLGSDRGITQHPAPVMEPAPQIVGTLCIGDARRR
ncbi:MAG: hypothetical protein ACLFS9_02210 [Nitriliruptoraceae bacterium]